MKALQKERKASPWAPGPLDSGRPPGYAVPDEGAAGGRPEREGADRVKLGGIIAAAGLSTRMGAFKPLLPLDGRPILCREADLLLAAGADPLVVVTGHRADEVARALVGSPPAVRLLYNPDYRGDMFLSVRLGAAALPRETEAFFFLPADCPDVRPATLEGLLRAFRAARPDWCVPVYAGRRGHPPLLSGRLLAPLLAYGGEGGLKGFLRQYAPLEVPVDDPEVTRDMDTPEEYRSLTAGRRGGGV